MSVPGSISAVPSPARPAHPLRPVLVPAILATVLALGLFAAPAVPERLGDWAALRAEMFFQGLGQAYPAASGDGPLAILLQPMFGTGHALVQVIWELAAAIFLAVVAVLGLRGSSRRQFATGFLLLLGCTILLPEAGWWFAAALAARMLWQKSASADAFVVGAGLGLFGLLSFNFWTWGAGVLLLSWGRPGGVQRDRVAGFAGWSGVTLTGWTIAHGGLGDFGHFLSAGGRALGLMPMWQLVAGVILAALAGWTRREGKTAALFTLACALCAVPLRTETARMVSANLADALPARQRAWSVLVHPERFENRVLQPAWHRLGASCDLPGLVDQLGNAPVDVLGPLPLVATANAMRQLPGSRRTTARAVLAPAGLDLAAELPARSYHRLMVENGIALYLHDQPFRSGFSPWALEKIAAFANAPSLIESSAPPEGAIRENAPTAGFHLPARLVFGPTPFASKQVVGKFFWDGGRGRVRVRLLRADGSGSLLMERGLNPASQAADRGLQSFILDLPDSTTNWVEVEAQAEGPAEVPGIFRLADLEFKRDLNRMMSTTLTPDVLHNGAGFSAMPVIIFSTSEAAPNHGEHGQSKLLVHMPAVVAFAKPKEVTRLTGTFGFLPGAYENPGAGTAGAVFNIMWFSGNDGAKQIFSRTLRPRTQPADQGPQTFDLDLSSLSDGILSFTISPAVAGDISWGWTYLGAIDLRREQEAPDAERFGEIMDAYRAGLRPLPGLIKTNEQKPRLIAVGESQLLRVHAPGEAIFGVTAGHTKAIGKFGFADEAWQTSGRTDGADFVVLWRDQHGDVELFRQHLQPDTNPADRGVHPFTVNLTGRGNGLLVLRTEPGPANNNYWDWTGWSDLTVW